MSIAWLFPAALAGITLVLLPIAIHLLVRQHARTQLYPSLRFLRETQLAAFRRRRIEDAALLLCRAAIIALAAVGLPGPSCRRRRVPPDMRIGWPGCRRDRSTRGPCGLARSTLSVG